MLEVTQHTHSAFIYTYSTISRDTNCAHVM